MQDADKSQASAKLNKLNVYNILLKGVSQQLNSTVTLGIGEQIVESMDAEISAVTLTKEGFTSDFVEAEGDSRPIFISDFPTAADDPKKGCFFDFYYSQDIN